MVKKLSVTVFCLLAGAMSACTTGPIGQTSINPETYGRSVESNFNVHVVEFDEGAIETGPTKTRATATNRATAAWEAGKHTKGISAEGTQ